MKHSNKILSYSVLLTAAIFLSSFTSSGINSKFSYQLSQKTSFQNSGEKALVWIFFNDKGPDAVDRLSIPNTFLTKESIDRRFKRIKSENLFDERDIPVYSHYINEIKSAGIQIRHKSKWLNAVSCYADRMQLEAVAGNEFIKNIDLVKKYFKNDEALTESGTDISRTHENLQSDYVSEIDYGPSLNQSNIINVPPVHDRGYNGEEVLIASLDAGFDNLQHPCFSLIRQKGIRTYDFVNGDTIVANGSGRMGDGRHGTITLSLVCGYAPGSLVSPAYNSRFILAKTENSESETPLEEDNWIAAAEWADSLGADIITSSLGYVVFDDPYPSYSWASMDGNTPLITRAADIAVSKGIVVVISSGNAGYNATHNTLAAPADGDSVITVGALTSLKVRASYSSVGPTADGRIKPDVMAMGSFNYSARWGAGNTGYTNAVTGTSIACPMVAGVCALMLSANPNLSPIDVRNILRNTADSSFAPNNLRGWGTINALLAVQNAVNENTSYPADYQLLQNFPNPFNPTTVLRFNLNKSANVSLIIYDVTGKEIDRPLDNKFFTVGSGQISYTNPNISSGVYFYSLIVNGALIDTKKMMLIY
ncbi:MAG: S8 family peptidase [Ignavibacteria bacterium]|nr:S8 family peptidase [Ignavibacteria bacterium]